jgi:hypothetical protein
MRGVRVALATVAVATALAACGAAAGTGTTGSTGSPAASTGSVAHWTAFAHVGRPLDVVGPRAGGGLVVAAAGRLQLLSTSGRVTGFAPAYRSPGGEEPYIALAPAAGCFRAPVYALRLKAGRGVVAIGAGGRVSRLATLTARGLLSGIAFDTTGAFGHRLLVTISSGTTATVASIGCRGGVSTVTTSGPRVEGGIAVAPPTFGRFAGDLIASDEISGRVFAITPNGRTLLVADSRLPHGQDIGVESEGFVGPGALKDALVADRLTPGNRHPGDDVVLRLRAAVLRAAGVRAGDLLVAGEGGAATDAIRCSRAGCRVRHVADGPAVAHLEGHIAFG